MYRISLSVKLLFFLSLCLFPLEVNSKTNGVWAWANPLPTGSPLNAVIRGNNQFLAVGMYGTIITSSDGVHWTSQISGVSDNLHGITSATNGFIAVGGGWPTGPIILNSENGVSWESNYIEGFESWDTLYDVAWNGKIFVAVGDHFSNYNAPLILSSSDGETWTPQDIGISLDLYSIVWDGKQFVAVGKRVGTCHGGCSWVCTSPDGNDWSLHLIPYLGGLIDIAWSAELELFVAIGVDDYDSAVLTSTDGSDWSIQPFSNVNFIGITWAGTRFVIVGSGGTILTSVDGTNWSPETTETDENINDVVYDSMSMVAVGNGGMIITSNNAEDWIIRTQSLIDTYNLNDVIWADERFIAVGYTPTESFVISSKNGSEWILNSETDLAFMNAIAWNGELFVAVGLDGTILTSPNIENWTKENSGTTRELTDIAWGNNQFVAVGSGGTVYNSQNGRIWDSRSTGTNGSFNRIIWGNKEFVAVGTLFNIQDDTDTILQDSPIVITSIDGELWESHDGFDALTSGIIYSVAWGNGKYMVLKDNGAFITSNWLDWLQFDDVSISTLRDVTWGENRFVAVGGDSDEDTGIIFTYTEEEGWTGQDGISKHPFYGVAWNGNQFVTIGERGAILHKSNITHVEDPEDNGGGGGGCFFKTICQSSFRITRNSSYNREGIMINR